MTGAMLALRRGRGHLAANYRRSRWQPFLAHAPWGGLAEFSARGKLHLKRRSFAWRRHHPDAAAMHLDNLLGDGEAESRAAFGLGHRAVDLMELLKDPILLVK